MTDPAEARAVAALLEDAARAAGRVAMEARARGFRHWTKAGNSPVTEADLAADAYLRERLLRELPGTGWLSEETADDPVRLDMDRVFIVDPIDGTRAFVAGFPDWCVSVALVDAGRPVAGALVAPVPDEVYVASVGGGAVLNGRHLGGRRLGGRSVPDGEARLAAGPERMIDAAARHVGPLVPAPRTHSLALRLAGVAAGRFKLAFAGGNSHDWDLAAADLLLHEAAGRLATLDGAAPRYNAPDPVHGPLIALDCDQAGLDLATLAHALSQPG